MSPRKRRIEDKQDWFLSDRPIDSAEEDRLGSVSVARVLANAIESAKPPCMIGLLGGFGCGKSSTGRLTSSMLDDSRFDTVTVSADKHSGSARARNLVHAVAGELQDLPKIDPDEVTETLRPLRQATQVAAPDPTDTPWTRLLSGRYSLKKWLKAMLPGLVVVAALAVLALLTDGPLRDGIAAVASLTVLGWFVALPVSGRTNRTRGMNASAIVTDQMPRAEAADEIEAVFGQLVDLHKEKRNGRRLVILVDDIDRLSNDDLLDALRSLRSLQSVPRGAEPIFVISCDEAILRSAVKDSNGRPATPSTKSPPNSDDPAKASQGANALLPNNHRKRGSEHDHPALAFVDKLLTVRVQMPPAMGGDMRRFALRAVGDDHPLRTELGSDTDRILSILIHDGVNEPRSAIRLINRFMAAYLLAEERESAEDIALGDITHHLGLLAQLCVLLDEYPQLYAEIADNSVLLSAAHKVVLRNPVFAASERDALVSSAHFNGNEPFSFAQPSLRRYLSGSAKRVGQLPNDIGPLIHFTATPGGRILGARLRSAIISGVESGDHEDLAKVLGKVPEDQIGAAAGEIGQLLHDASPVDANTYVSAIAPNLHLFEYSAGDVADACANLLDQAPDESIAAHVLTEIISHTGTERHQLLCQRLTRHDNSIESTNSRFVHTTNYLASNPQIKSLVESSISQWVTGLPSEGSWDLAQSWLGPAEALNPEQLPTLRHQIVTALVKSIRSEDRFSSEDANRLIVLAESTIEGKSSAAPNAEDLANDGPNTKATFVRLWDITSFDGDVECAFLAASTAADPKVDTEVRKLAIRQTVAWVEEWKDAEWETDEEAQEREVSDAVIDYLVDTLSESTLLAQVADVLPSLAVELGAKADDLMSKVTDIALELADQDPAAASAARALITSVEEAVGTEHEGEFDSHAERLFEVIDSDSDPADPTVQLALLLIPAAVQTEAGQAILGPLVEQWSNGLVRHVPTGHRTRIEGLRVISNSRPTIIEEYSNPQAIRGQLNQLANDQSYPQDRLRCLAQFPWPDSQIVSVLTILDRHWQNLPEDTLVDALELVIKASDEFELLSRFHDRICLAVQDEPSGVVSKIAADELRRMDTSTKAGVYESAVGRHDAVTSQWTTLDAETASQVVYECSDDIDALGRLLEALTGEHKATVAAESLAQMATSEEIDEEAVQLVASHCDNNGLAHAAQIALNALAEPSRPSQERASALFVIIAARKVDANVETGVLQERAEALLPEATVEIAGLLGQSLAGTRPRRGLQDALKQLREDDGTKGIAGAFDSGRKARPRGQ